MKQNSKAKIITAVVCVIALFIPTVIAITAFIANQKEDIEEQVHEITALTVTDTDGKQFSYAKESDSIGMIGIFDNIFNNSKKVSALSNTVRALPAYYVKVTRADQSSTTYKFYFSTKGASYYEDDLGNAFGISTENCSAFFSTECAVTLFYNTHVPELKNAFGTIISPSEMTWKYLNYSGEYADVNVNVSSEVGKYELDGAFTLNFDIAPDFTKAVLYDGDNAVYDGPLSGIATDLIVNQDTTFRMEITAEWYQDDKRDYCGKAKYVFSTDVAALAYFTLGANSVEAGQIAVINAQNIKDPSLIKVSFSPALTYKGKEIKPVFYGADGNYTALVPIPAGCFADSGIADKTMTYQIDLSYGATNRSLNLDVTDRTNLTTTEGDVALDLITTLRTKENLDTFAQILADAAQKSANAKLWQEEKFFSYAEDGFKFSLAFGKYWRLQNGIKYQNEMLSYRAKGEYHIVATNGGVVVAVGENPYLGKYVCIDHGMGLQSWYLHLSDTSVEVGDTVEAVSIKEYDKNYNKPEYDKAIGKVSPKGSGFIENSDISFSVMYTVGGVPVCPYSLSSGIGLEETGIGSIVAFR